MKRIQTGDSVIVIAGKCKGAKSTVTSIVWDFVTLKWVNMQKKAVKGEWFKEKEGKIRLSSVAHFDEKSASASKIGVRKDKKGKKERFYKKSGVVVK